VGYVDRHGARRLFGVAERTWSQWEKQGRITCGRMIALPGQPPRKVYPIDELRRLVVEFEQRNCAPFPPAGWVDMIGASRMFSVSLSTWMRLERIGKIKIPSQFLNHPAKPARCKVYAIQDLERLKEDFRRLEEQCEPYPDSDRPGCWRVPVMSKLHRVEAIIDEASLPLVQGKRWNFSPGKRAGGGGGSVVMLIPGSPQKPPLHQVIMGVSGPEQRVAHLNGDPLDCRRENLVVRTRAQERAAAGKLEAVLGEPTSSQFKGVRWTDEGRKWQAQIKVGGKHRLLGRFRSEIDAALAYDAAARQLHGEHARLNLPDVAEVQRLRAAEVPDVRHSLQGVGDLGAARADLLRRLVR
jgi:hypothetical protein